MGHWCRICDRIMANEKFSGAGHKRHICRLCVRMPLEDRRVIEQKAEISSFLDQSNISKKNMKRLKELASSTNPEVSERARVVFEVALFQPHKRRRLKNMAHKRPELMEKLADLKLIFLEFSCCNRSDFDVDFDFEDAWMDELPNDIVEFKNNIQDSDDEIFCNFTRVADWDEEDNF